VEYAQVRIDETRDGEIDGLGVIRFYEGRKMTRWGFDSLDEGERIYRIRRKWNNGRKVREEFGVPSSESVQLKVWNWDGSKLKRRRWFVSTRLNDELSRENLTKEVTWKWKSDRKSRKEIDGEQPGGGGYREFDGSPDVVWTWSWEDNRNAMIEIDNTGPRNEPDGEPDDKLKRRYENGHLVSETWNAESNVITRKRTWERENGKKVRRVSREGGEIKSIMKWSWKNGLLVNQKLKDLKDGDEKFHTIFSRKYHCID